MKIGIRKAIWTTAAAGLLMTCPLACDREDDEGTSELIRPAPETTVMPGDLIVPPVDVDTTNGAEGTTGTADPLGIQPSDPLTPGTPRP